MPCASTKYTCNQPATTRVVVYRHLKLFRSLCSCFPHFFFLFKGIKLDGPFPIGVSVLVLATGVVYYQMEHIYAVGIVIPVLNSILICAIVYWGHKSIGSDHDSADESSRTKGLLHRNKEIISGRGEIDNGKVEESSLKNLSTSTEDSSSSTTPRQVEE